MFFFYFSFSVHRKLQFHLAKVEELQEQYEKELKVREGKLTRVVIYEGQTKSYVIF